MRKGWKILIAAGLIATLAFGSMGCKKEAEDKSSSSSKVEKETTKEPTKKPTKEATATPSAEPTEEVTPEPENNVESKNVNLLTGLDDLSPFAEGKRPVAVMVNNVTDALPQYGVAAADLIFEIPVEGDLTRLMAMYADITEIPNIASIRSCRYYFPILAVGFDAFYAHWGMDDTIARDILNSLDIDSMDGMDNDFLLFGRDQERIAQGFSLEHTAFFEGTRFAERLGAQRLDLKDEKKQLAFSFNKKGAHVNANGEAKNQAVIDFGASGTTMNFDAASSTYKMNHNDSPQMDSHTNTQLAFTNVIILETDISVRDDVGRKNVNWQGGPNYNGYYMSGGHVQKIHWSKPGEYDYLTFTDEAGNPLSINRGKTYIAFNYPNQVTFG